MTFPTTEPPQKPVRKSKMKITELNQHLSCILCGGYFIDATTIIECLHSFCRACIVRYLETSKYCPVCEVQIHKSKPLQCIRTDRTLQDIVYKLVPGLFENEMKKRRELYSSLPPEDLMKSRDAEDRGEDLDQRFIYTPDELFNICIQYKPDESPSDSSDEVTKKEDPEEEKEGPRRRYLRCPAALGIENLKKFIRAKYEIPNRFQLDLLYDEYSLEDNYTLMDVAYIFEWRRAGVMRVFYRVLEKPRNPPPPLRVYEKDDLKQVQKQDDDASNPTPSCSKEEPPAKVSSLAKSSGAIEKVPRVRQKSQKSKRKGRPPIPIVKIAIAEINAAERLRLAESTRRKSEKRNSTAKEESRSERHSTGDKTGKKSSQMSLSSDSTKSAKTEHSSKVQSAMAINNKLTKSTTNFEKEKSPTLKVPKLTIPLTPKILQEVALQAEEDKADLDCDFYEGRLVIAEPDASPRDTDDDNTGSSKDFKPPELGDVGTDAKKSDEDLDDCEVDSGRGSDISSRADLRSLCGDDDIGSPGSSSVRTPDLDKQNPFLMPSPSSASLPSPNNTQDQLLEKGDLNNNSSKISELVAACALPRDGDFGVLDLSVCHRKRGYDRNPMARPKQVANPPVLDKYRQTTPCLPMPKHPSFKLLPAVLPHTSIYQKPEVFRSNFRCRGSTLTVINPDPNSCRPKIVIKNLDPRSSADHGHNRHHHHHHHNHHHQRM